MKISLRQLKGFEMEPRFTKWLSKNIRYIESLLGITIEGNPIPEYPIGSGTEPDRLDIFAKTIDGKKIAIENQYGVADNEHLGKLIEYSAYVDADIIILISESVDEKHFNTLNWLEQNLGNKKIYHIIVEAFDNQDVPNLRFLDNQDIVKRNKKGTETKVPVFANHLERFWTEFERCVKEKYPFFDECFSYNAKTKQRYITVTPLRLKKSYNLNVVFRTSLNEYYAEIKFSNREFDCFRFMEENKEVFIEEMGEEVVFQLMNKTASIGLLNRKKGYIDSEISYEKYACDLIENIIRLDKVASDFEKIYHQQSE